MENWRGLSLAWYLKTLKTSRRLIIRKGRRHWGYFQTKKETESRIILYCNDALAKVLGFFY